jgi:Ni,Fe-hydrogenase III component G
MTEFKLTSAQEITKNQNIDEIVKESVQNMIDSVMEEIQIAIPAKVNRVRLEIPTTFDFPTMDRRRSQTYAYYYLLDALSSKNYYPKLQVKGVGLDQRAFLEVTWHSPDQARMEREMHDYIRRYSQAMPEAGSVPQIAPVRRRRK